MSLRDLTRWRTLESKLDVERRERHHYQLLAATYRRAIERAVSTATEDVGGGAYLLPDAYAGLKAAVAPLEVPR